MDIIIDTREQKPLWTKNNAYTKIIRKKLDVGDYSLVGFENKIALERKSAGDLFCTLGAGHKRFKAELFKAHDLDYFAIIIEDSYTNILNKNFKNSFQSKMRGYVITSILFTIHLKYKVPVFFTNSRSESKKVIREIFKAYLKLKGGNTNGKRQ